ncbi:MAG: DUF305 domain-containing protein [Proteobacteria bacterium]|nr:DUF305 domain-containing protein [Pseudomonadota bacterium]
MPMGHSMPSGSMPGMAMPSQGGSAADKAMMDGMATMNRDMSAAPMTGDPDHDFVAMMIPHHQGAIDMAEVVLKYGKDPQIRKLAQDIVAAQKKEIAEMKAWQAAHPAR